MAKAIGARWTSDGVLDFYDRATGLSILLFDQANQLVKLASGVKLDGASIDLSQTELGLLDGATAGSITASKVVSRDAGLRIPFASASPAAAGTLTSDATALTADENFVTGADGATGVKLPTGVAGMRIRVVNTVATTTALLKVYPDAGGAINGGSADAAVTVAPGATATFVCTAALTWQVEKNALLYPVIAVAGGYKIARSAAVVAVTGSATVASGLTSIVAAFAGLSADASVKAYPGVQALISGTDVVLKVWMPTTGGAAGNPTPIASDQATNVSWFAIGT